MRFNRNTGYPHSNRLVVAKSCAFAVALIAATSAWLGVAAAQGDKYVRPQNLRYRRRT